MNNAIGKKLRPTVIMGMSEMAFAKAFNKQDAEIEEQTKLVKKSLCEIQQFLNETGVEDVDQGFCMHLVQMSKIMRGRVTRLHQIKRKFDFIGADQN